MGKPATEAKSLGSFTLKEFSRNRSAEASSFQTSSFNENSSIRALINQLHYKIRINEQS